MRPGTWVDDDSVRPAECVVTPVDVLALVIRLAAAHVTAEVGCPFVDARLELRQREASVQLGVAAREHVEVDPVQDDDLHGATLIRDQLVEGSAVRGLRLCRLPLPLIEPA